MDRRFPRAAFPIPGRTTIVVGPVMIFGDLVLGQICEVTDEDGIAVEINQV